MGILTVCTASYIVISQIDVDKIDMKDWGTIYMQKIQEWVEANPEASEKDAEKIAKMLMEYKELALE